MENEKPNYVFTIHDWKPSNIKQWLNTDATGEWWTAKETKGDKMMTNWERFREELLKIAATGHGFGVIDGKPTYCVDTSCNDCLFTTYILDNPCYKQRFEWLDEEYEEPKCKSCVNFHLGEGLEDIGVCDVTLKSTRINETCDLHKERRK